MADGTRQCKDCGVIGTMPEDFKPTNARCRDCLRKRERQREAGLRGKSVNCESCGKTGTIPEDFRPDRKFCRQCDKERRQAEQACAFCGGPYWCTPEVARRRRYCDPCGAFGPTNLGASEPVSNGPWWKSTPVPWTPCVECAKPYTRRDSSKRCFPCRERPRLCRECDTPAAFYSPYCVTHQEAARQRIQVAFVEYRRTRVKTKASKRAQAARRRGAITAEVVKPDDIYRRDKYRCQLCGRPLDFSVEYPHDDYPTLDHVLPIALGGLHTAANLQAAHNRCNYLKGHRILGDGEQLRLVG